MSRAMEDVILLDGAHGRIFSSFQRMSRFLPQAERYQKLAEKAEHVYIFGEKDVEVPIIPNTTYVFLSKTDALVKEWFVVAYAPEYQSVLATRELSDIDDPDDIRTFQGIWTFDRNMVDIIQEWLSSAVDAHPLPFSNENAPIQQQIRIIRHNIQHITKQHPLEEDHPIIQEELQSVVNEVLTPHLSLLETKSNTKV
jgi:DICT domain-containing protein